MVEGHMAKYFQILSLHVYNTDVYMHTFAANTQFNPQSKSATNHNKLKTRDTAKNRATHQRNFYQPCVAHYLWFPAAVVWHR